MCLLFVYVLVIGEILRDECIPKKTCDIWQDIAAGFLQRTNFPNSVGAFNGKQIKITEIYYY